LRELEAEWAAQDAADRQEMAIRIRERQLVSPSQHMDLAEQQLREMK